MTRGKAIQPQAYCEYCNKELPTLRHPEMRYCNAICRERDRYQRNHAGKGITCLDCGLLFTRVGSHVVQVHGYESTAEYRYAHGLKAIETHTKEHAQEMREKVSTIDNLQSGEPTRFKIGGTQGKVITEFWNNRHKKRGGDK